MTEDQFWDIVAQVHRASNGDFDRKCELLEAELLKLPLAKVQAFHVHFSVCRSRAYTEKLWAAAAIISGYESDDGFFDFHSTLVSMGRETFERALADPDTLAEVASEDDGFAREGYQYVPDTVIRSLGGEPIDVGPPPDALSGQPMTRALLPEVFPKLAKKFPQDWDDTD